MGTYDEVELTCPKCSHLTIIQSKAGDCTFRSYSDDNVPASIAEDLDGQNTLCDNCGYELTIVTKTIVVIRLKLKE